MDNKYSFLDQDGLFSDSTSASPGLMPVQPAGPVKAPVVSSMPSSASPPQQTNNSFVEVLDSIARALAYTEKRVASAEARIMSALQDATFDKKTNRNNSWSIMAIFGGLVVLFLILGIVVACIKRAGNNSNIGVSTAQVPYIVRAAPGQTPLILPSGPPATFLS